MTTALQMAASDGEYAGQQPDSFASQCPFMFHEGPLRTAWFGGFSKGRSATLGPLETSVALSVAECDALIERLEFWGSVGN
jgi:hypothetical protein